MNASAIGQRLKDLRKSRGVTLRALSERIGIHYASLGHAERGRYPLGRETLTRLAEELGVDTDLLLAEAGFQKPPFRVLGNVAAGVPIDAVEDVETFDLTEAFDPTGHYLLRIKGDSMIEDGILDGDMAVIRHAGEPKPGDTVVAVIDSDEGTLKRFSRKGPNVLLTPANRRMKQIVVPASQVEIRGVLVGVLRLRVS